MTDQSYFTTLFADNNTGDISASDLREFVAEYYARPVNIIIPISDETTALVAGSGAYTISYWPYNVDITDIVGMVTTAPTGADIIVDINITGTGSIFSTNLHIDAGDTDSSGSATSYALTTTSFSEGDVVTFDIDQVGSTENGKGLKILIKGTLA